MKDHIKDILDKYPAMMKTVRSWVARVPFSIRLGHKFWEWFAFFEESQSWSQQEIEDFQTERLRNLLVNLLQYSPYYRNRLCHLNCKTITLEQFRNEVPQISKDEFRDNFPTLLSSNWKNQKPQLSHTSGTTGKALKFYNNYEDQYREWAAICHQWKRVGYDPANSKRAEFRGLTPHEQMIEYHPNKNYIRCSITHINKQHIQTFADAIRESKISFFHGYPSALYVFAKLIQETGIAVPQPQAILLASELVYDWQIDQLLSVFPSAKIYAHYGCAERTVLAGWCETRQIYHVLPQYALVEIDPTHSEIIGTNLYNTINGFVRYKMADFAPNVSWDVCPDCHRPYIPRFSALIGRLGDLLYSIENDSWIASALFTYAFKGLTAIQDTQLVQKEKHRITFRYTTVSTCTQDQVQRDIEHIRQGMEKIIGKRTQMDFIQVEEFQMTKNGKRPWLICEMDEMRHANERSE